MFFHSLDYMMFLGLALVAFWLLATRFRFSLSLVLAATFIYFGIAWEGYYLLPIAALLAIDFGAFDASTVGGRVRAFFSRPHAARMTLLFVMSCAFYMAWQAHYIWLILASTCIDFFVGQVLYNSQSPRARRALLSLSVVGNLGLLFTFKYYNFFAAELGQILVDQGWNVSVPILDAMLPVGISFYTFQTLSYTIDIYRGQLKPARDFITFAAFVAYFPQLVAGPIVRASELLPQLEKRPSLTRNQVSDGLFLIATGLVKKLAIADYLALGIVDRVFVEPDKFTALEVIVALYAFTMQLYCDFSGYTDVARGSAKLMGYELPENFDRPYQATNPADFWRRWHMTLSRWLRDYLYFPLGGSRRGPVRAYWNLALTMFLVGIWHGSWQNFEVFFWYALLQAGAMVAHRLWHRGAIGRGLFMRKLDAEGRPIEKGESSPEGLQKDKSRPSKKRRRTKKRSLKKERPLQKVVTSGDTVDRRVSGSSRFSLRHVLFVFLNLQFVVFSRILFRSGAENEPMEISASLVERIRDGSWTAIQVPWSMWTLLGVTFALHFVPRRHFDFAQESFRRVPAIWKGVLLAGVAVILMEVASREALPFQYFQF